MVVVVVVAFGFDSFGAESFGADSLGALGLPLAMNTTVTYSLSLA